ncbi:MAG TPA: hypothetical protein VF297_01765 [Pyrinomonadaceae bacterium]
MFKVEMFPAGFGDCLWIEYGAGAQVHRVLIDGGISGTYKAIKERVESLPLDDRHFELFVVTHIDADHIEGSIRLLGAMNSLGVSFSDVWFNGWKHLPEEEDDGRLGGEQGEFLSALIERQGVPWNVAFRGKAVLVPDKGALPVVTLPGGLRLTLLSPTLERLKELRGKWEEEVRKAKLDRDSLDAVLRALEERAALRPEDDLSLGEQAIKVEELARTRFESDDSKANGSSIAVLVEFDGKRCLLTGDAYATELETNIKRLLDDGDAEVLKLDLLKLPHHGSAGNVSNSLLRLLDCPRYLFSTNGKRYKHPDRAGVARVIVNGGERPSLYFNYRTEFNDLWDDPALKADRRHPYKTFYPEEGKNGYLVDLTGD